NRVADRPTYEIIALEAAGASRENSKDARYSFVLALRHGLRGRPLRPGDLRRGLPAKTVAMSKKDQAGLNAQSAAIQAVPQQPVPPAQVQPVCPTTVTVTPKLEAEYQLVLLDPDLNKHLSGGQAKRVTRGVELELWLEQEPGAPAFAGNAKAKNEWHRSRRDLFRCCTHPSLGYHAIDPAYSTQPCAKAESMDHR